MPTYEVEQYELHYRTHVVSALTPEAAVQHVINPEAGTVHIAPVIFIETYEPRRGNHSTLPKTIREVRELT